MKEFVFFLFFMLVVGISMMVSAAVLSAPLHPTTQAVLLLLSLVGVPTGMDGVRTWSIPCRK